MPKGPRDHSPRLDEEALALEFSAERREQGRYFTPGPVVDLVLDLVKPLLPSDRALSIIDPACGAGAFLAAGADVFPSARLFGLELSPAVAARCRERVPRAEVRVGDGLRGGLDPLLARVP